jgi:hypothetical protein
MFAAGLLLFGCATRPAPAPSPVSARPQLAIVGVTVIPMSGKQDSLPGRTVIIRDGRIQAIGPTARVKPPAGARIIDGRGRFLMPALTDAHVHLEYSEDPNLLKLFVANGVTTVRSMDGRPYLLDWRERVRTGALVGPRIVTAGPIIDGSPPARPDNLAVADPAAARAAVAEQGGAGYDFIKLYLNLSPEAYEAAVDEARRRGLRVAGHVPRGVSLAQAVQGQWSIEHLGDFAASISVDGATVPGWIRRFLGAPIDPARLEALATSLAAARVWVIPTSVQKDRELAPSEAMNRWLAEPSIRHIPPDFLAAWRGQLERFQARMDADDWALVERARLNRLAVISAFHKAGVLLAVGSDTPNPFVAMGASVHLELANFVAAGLSPRDALMAATLNPARMLGLEREQGSVAVGRRADLLLLSADPLMNVGNAERRVGLVLDGRWLAEEELQSMTRALRPAA